MGADEIFKGISIKGLRQGSGTINVFSGHAQFNGGIYEHLRVLPLLVNVVNKHFLQVAIGRGFFNRSAQCRDEVIGAQIFLNNKSLQLINRQFALTYLLIYRQLNYPVSHWLQVDVELV